MNRGDFGEGFVWGVASAAVQIEGAVDSDGKGPSIWDAFSKKRGKIKNRDTNRYACDFYNRYEEDLLLMNRMNIKHFRFSISWSRILPDGTGQINQRGIDFYNELINKCLSLNIKPWITLYHWDLPQALEQQGGWTNRAILDWFEEYVELCIKSFGDRVKHWMIMNEPTVFTAAGYFLGIHAPGRLGLSSFLAASHHAALAMGKAGRAIRKICPDAQIGTTFSCSPIEPARPSKTNLKAVSRVDTIVNRLFIEPILGLGYPIQEFKALAKIKKFMLPGDEELLAFNFDFIGLQNYTREVVRYSCLMPYLKAKLVSPRRRQVANITEMGWEVYPQAIYEVIKQFSSYTNCPPIYITENGAAFSDTLSNGKVSDPKRIAYIQAYLETILKAKKAGYDVRGYFIWTFTDNFEWAEGYHPRFGLVHVDFRTQKRTVKDSGIWYANFIHKD